MVPRAMSPDMVPRAMATDMVPRALSPDMVPRALPWAGICCPYRAKALRPA
jgi:hypothetical protein